MIANLQMHIFVALIIFASLGWLLSLKTKKVTHVDSMWSLFFVIVTLFCFINPSYESNLFHNTFFIILLLWALRLSLHLTIRNWNKPEDIRYQKIRQNNEPGFMFKSIYIIFFFQATLAFIISLPLIYIASESEIVGLQSWLGLFVMATGLVVEVIADNQLKQFLKKKNNKTLQAGLWRYSRHPNYFGECLIWWGIFICASLGPIYLLVSPLLMNILLVKISGADLMESTIPDRRPDYRAYIKKTSRFIPWPPKY